MKNLIGALSVLLLAQSNVAVADRGGTGAYAVSGTMVVGGRYGPGGGYRGPRGGYYGPRWGYRGPSVGVYFGGPVGWGGPWWGPPAYYPQPIYPPVINVPPPVVYVERDDPLSASSDDQALAPGYWYYCRENAAYYPAVMQCPGPWEQVAPRPD